MSEATVSGTDERRASGQYLQLGTYRIRYFEEGSGPVLLMIHGLGQAMYTFRRNVHVLSEYAHVITLDLPGHGLSDKPETVGTLESYTDVVIDFIDAMELSDVTLLGFSTGAEIALNVSLKAPEKLRQLVLLSPGGITKTFPGCIRRAGKPLFSDLIFNFFSVKMMRKALKSAYFDTAYVTGEVVRHYYKVLGNRENLDAAMNSFAAWDDRALMEQLSSVSIPTYLFWGEQDEWHPLSMLEAFEDGLEELYVGTFADCGHALHVERAAELNKKLIALIGEE